MSMEYRSLFDTDTDTLLSEISSLEQQQQQQVTATTGGSTAAVAATNMYGTSNNGPNYGTYASSYPGGGGAAPNAPNSNSYGMGYGSAPPQSGYYPNSGQMMPVGMKTGGPGYGHQPPPNQQQQQQQHVPPQAGMKNY